MPSMMTAPLDVDYPTDEDSDGENKGFGMKIPDLGDLINEFEKEDEVLAKANEASKIYKNEIKVKGLELEKRYDIKDIKKDKVNHLDSNISMQRDEWGSKVIGTVEDMNEVIKDSKNKIYLR
jgi:hypothetical protein